MVEDSAFSHKIDYVSAILLSEWILTVGGPSAVEGLPSTGLPRLVRGRILSSTFHS